MANKRKKSEQGAVKGFNLDSDCVATGLKWQTPDGFAFKNTAQQIELASWPVDVLAFHGQKKQSETLLILLGPLESVYVYKHLLVNTLKTRNVVFVSLPGFGLNMSVDLSAENIELKSFAPFVIALLNSDALVDQKVHVMGSSAAASIALETALQTPTRVSSLIVNGLVHRPSKVWQLLLKEVTNRLDSGDYLDCADAALLYLVSDEILGRGKTWGVFRRYFRKKLSLLTDVEKNCLNKVVQLILMGDGLNEVHLKDTPQCPVLAFTGEYDHLSSPYDHAHFSDACINGVFATLDDADHLIHVERPRVVAKVISSFLDKQNLDSLSGVRTYPPQSYVTLDRRRDPRYVTSRPKVKLETTHVIVPEGWEDEVPRQLLAKLRNINFSGCLLELNDERFSVENHAKDLKLYLPKIDTWLKILAFEQVNKSLRCLFLHENYQSAMAFKEMLDYGEHFVDADLELDDYDIKSKRDMPWLGAKRQGGGVY